MLSKILYRYVGHSRFLNRWNLSKLLIMLSKILYRYVGHSRHLWSVYIIRKLSNVPVQNFGQHNQQLGEIPSIQKPGVPSPGMPLNQQQDEVTNMLAMFERMRRI